MIIPFVKLVALVPPAAAILPESREKFDMTRKITPTYRPQTLVDQMVGSGIAAREAGSA
jgi:hypothetical protein